MRLLASRMQARDIITKFEQYVDDTTELSSQQELDLLDKVYQKVCMERDWEFLKAPASGTFSLNTPNIILPDNFSHLCENNQYTDNNMPVENNAVPKVIFIGADYQPFQVVNWSDRRQYRNQSGFAYLDLPNNGITFSVPPAAVDTYEFDYIIVPEAIDDLTDEPIFPERFQPMLYHLMAIDDEIILHFPRANSYALDNKAAADDYMAQMALWNANLRAN
jgi:hypothetical protein